MKISFLFVLLLSSVCIFAQEDYSWWNEIHGWQPGMPSWKTFVRITPGYLGPNALPVPEVKKGILSEEKQIEFGTDFHFVEGDQAQNLFGKLYYPFAGNKIAVELYGVMLEHYSMSEKVRDERFARDKDGKGLAVGDLYFSTLIQLVKDRRFPNTLLRMVGKTASGGRLDAARYADTPGYFFDVSFSKEYYAEKYSIMPFISLGFYSWQTNDDETLQNDAYMYAAGLDWKCKKLVVSNSFSGYSGYKNEKDRPVIYNFDLLYNLTTKSIRFQYLHGFRDWNYNTLKLSLIWKWN